MTSVYDDPALQPDNSYVKFEDEGDTVTGVIFDDPTIHTFDDGKKALKLQLRTADGDVTLTAGQIKLKEALNEARPVKGDTVTITFTRLEKRPGGKTMKHFDVNVTKGDGSVPDAPANDEVPF